MTFQADNSAWVGYWRLNESFMNFNEFVDEFNEFVDEIS